MTKFILRSSSFFLNYFFLNDVHMVNFDIKKSNDNFFKNIYKSPQTVILSYFLIIIVYTS